MRLIRTAQTDFKLIRERKGPADCKTGPPKNMADLTSKSTPAAQSTSSELVEALGLGVSLELFHHFGAPTAGDLERYLNGTATPSRDHQAQISEALARLKRTRAEGR